MRKILLGTSGLIAVALVSGAAQAADPIKLQLGGFSNWWFGYAKQNETYQKYGNAGTNYTTFDVQGDNEIYFKGETKLDNGLKVGAQIELEAGGSQDTRTGAQMDVIDASWVYVESGFGKLEIGSTANAAAKAHVSAPTAGFAGLQDGDYGNWVVMPGNMNDLTNTYVGAAAANNETISYFTPEVAGFSLGLGYIPSLATEDNRAVTNNNVNNGEAYVAGIGYANKFGNGLGVKASVGYLTGDGSTLSTFHEWSGGLQVSYMGFTLGGSYKDSTQKQDRNPANFTGNGKGATDGHNWDLGIGYETGPYAITLGYYASDVEGTNTTAGKDKVAVWNLGGKYAMSPGVSLAASAFKVDYKDETGTAANKNDGWAVLTGIMLEF